MHPKPTNQINPWTQDEVSTLKRLIEEDTPPRAIARKLSRTLDALHYMMRIEELSCKGQPTP